MSGMGILAAIDAAVGCQQCGGPLGASPSDDFCCQDHQEAWYAAQTVDLVGYVEPYDSPGDLVGLGTERYRPNPLPPPPPVFRLPPQTGNLWADMQALNRASAAATTNAQRVACALRGQQLSERFHLAVTAMFDNVRPAVDAFVQQAQQAMNEIGRGIAAFLEPLTTTAKSHNDAQDVREQALHARRNRNTGPPAHRRPPRRLDAPGARR